MEERSLGDNCGLVGYLSVAACTVGLLTEFLVCEFSQSLFQPELESEKQQNWFNAPGKSDQLIVKPITAHDCYDNKRG